MQLTMLNYSKLTGEIGTENYEKIVRNGFLTNFPPNVSKLNIEALGKVDFKSNRFSIMY
jgi:hypothetical protein